MIDNHTETGREKMANDSTIQQAILRPGQYLVIRTVDGGGTPTGYIILRDTERGVIDAGDQEGWSYYVTTAPASYDYGGTIEIDGDYAGDTGKVWRLIAMRAEQAEYQIPRNRSGLYPTYTLDEFTEQCDTLLG